VIEDVVSCCECGKQMQRNFQDFLLPDIHELIHQSSQNNLKRYYHSIKISVSGIFALCAGVTGVVVPPSNGNRAAIISSTLAELLPKLAIAPVIRELILQSVITVTFR